MIKHLFLFLLLVTTNLFAKEAKIVRLKGEVTVSGKVVKLGDNIKEGAEVVASGKSSFVQLKFADGSMILLKDGVLKIERPQSKNSNSIKFMKGVMFVFKNNQSKNKFTVKTKNAAMGVRGTKFYVMESDQDSYLCVCHGTVEVTNTKGSININKKEDIHVTQNGLLKKTVANKMMWMVATQGFKEMGIPVK